MDAAFGAIGGTGTVGTFGVVRGNAVTAPGLLVLVLVLVLFCCLFEKERVNTGMRARKVECNLELEDFECKEKKINF